MSAQAIASIKMRYKCKQLHGEILDEYSEVQRVKMAVFAISNGVDNAAEHFSKLYNHPIKPEVIQAIKVNFLNQEDNDKIPSSKLKRGYFK